MSEQGIICVTADSLSGKARSQEERYEKQKETVG